MASREKSHKHQHRQQPSEPVHPQRSPDNHDNESSHASATDAPPDGLREENSSRTAQHTQDAPRWRMLLEVATVVIALGLLAVNICQSRSTETAAIAAKNSVELAKRTTQIDQRAWLFMRSAETANPPMNEIEIGKPLIVEVRAANTGKTPALHTRVINAFSILHTSGEVPLTIPPFDYSKAPSDYGAVGTVAPYVSGSDAGTMQDYVYTRKLLKMDYDDIKANRLHIFTHGKIIYCDAFGKEHWATWCYHLLSGGGYAICTTNNDTDTDDNPPDCALK